MRPAVARVSRVGAPSAEMGDDEDVGLVATVLIGGGFSLAVLVVWGMSTAAWVLLAVGVGVVSGGWLLALLFSAVFDWLDRREERPTPSVMPPATHAAR